MNKVKFSHNWNNKLNNNIFTTIRKHTLDKEDYYMGLINKDVEIDLKDKLAKIAVIRDVYRYKFSEILLCVLRLDTGINDISKLFELFMKFGIKGDDEVLLIVFESKTSLEVV